MAVARRKADDMDIAEVQEVARKQSAREDTPVGRWRAADSSVERSVMWPKSVASPIAKHRAHSKT